MNILFFMSFCISLIGKNPTAFNYSNWQVSSMHMSVPDYSWAAGYYNGTVHLLGGQWSGKRKFLYDISNGSMQKLSNSYYLSGRHSPSTQRYSGNNHYVQIQHHLYVFSNNRSCFDTIHVYDLKSRIFVTNITMQFPVSACACITSNNEDELLFISDGININPDGNLNSLDVVQIFNISDGLWWLNVSSLQISRFFHSCTFNIIQNELWVIGGYHGTTGGNGEIIASVEKLSIRNMITEFEEISTLKIGIEFSRAIFVEMNNSILVMGGYKPGSISDLQLIDCNTGNVQLVGNLKYPLRRSAGIMVNNIQYLFGGRNDLPTESTDSINLVQYLDFTQIIISTQLTTDPTYTDVIEEFVSYDNDICSITNGYNGFINTTYELSVTENFCIDDNNVIEFITTLLFVIDKIYHENELFVHSNISMQQRNDIVAFIDNNTYCSDITLNVLTCFNQTVNQNVLFNMSKTKDFEQNISDEIEIYSNNTIVWVYVTNTTIVYIFKKNNKNINWLLLGLILSVCIVFIIF
eukprot:305096_1